MDRLVPRGLARLGPVCARRRETWENFQARRSGIELVADTGAVFAADVDVISIITPPETHAGFVRRALESGKHVIVEKPAAATSNEAQKLVDLSRKLKLHLLCAPFVQLAPTFRAL